MLFQNTLCLKEIFEYIGYISSYLSKLNSGMEPVSEYFFQENLPYIIFYQLTTLQYQTFLISQNIEQFF